MSFVPNALSNSTNGASYSAPRLCCWIRGIIGIRRKGGGFGKGERFEKKGKRKGRAKGGYASMTQHSKASPATSRIEPSPATSRIEPSAVLKPVISIPFQKNETETQQADPSKGVLWFCFVTQLARPGDMPH